MKANHLFAFPVMITEKAAKNKLKDLWNVANLIANKGKVSKAKEISFEKKWTNFLIHSIAIATMILVLVKEK
jgi:hypothetical protein